jgi:predicted ATPase
MFNNRGTRMFNQKANSNYNELKTKSHKNEYKFFKQPQIPFKTVAKVAAVVGAVGVGAAVLAKAKKKKATHHASGHGHGNVKKLRTTHSKTAARHTGGKTKTRKTSKAA